MRKGGGDQFCPVFERRLRKLVQVPLYISENGIDEVPGLGSHGVFRNFNSFVQGCVVGSATHIGQLIKAEPENICQHGLHLFDSDTGKFIDDEVKIASSAKNVLNICHDLRSCSGLQLIRSGTIQRAVFIKVI